MQMDSVSCSTENRVGCDAIARNITYCKSRNVKVLMSMGGATVHDCGGSGCTGKYRFDTIEEANKTADEMYNMFFAGTINNSYWRPFGDVQMDGVDLDIEEKPQGGQTYQWYYDGFVTRLRELQGMQQLIVSAAPECHHGCPGNCNALEQTVNLTAFDYLFVQFYNDPSCSLKTAGFSSSLNYWLNLQGPNAESIIVLGVPGDNRTNDGGIMYFVPPAEVVSIYKDKHNQNQRVDGIGIWQASTIDAQFLPIIQGGIQGSTLNSGPYSLRILETSTTFYSETAGTWLMAHYLTTLLPDLFYIKTSNTGTGRVEVHVASGVSNYQNRILETGTTFAPENNGVWQIIDFDGDGKPDLVYIKTSNTGTGKVEVHVASGASNYQNRILETGTTFAPENNGVWQMIDYDGDGKPDLVYIKTSNTGTGKVEVHVASGASNYQNRILETGTTFAPENNGVWQMIDFDGDGKPDLVYIKTSNTGTGKVEVHVASGASNYQNRILETGTTFAPENNGVWQMIDYDGDGKPDLVYIKTSNTGTGKVEVHVAEG
ncbi:hypothetical protein N7466_006501 [Penicillium verhagenii]|uniref:uncharacterized protein n=1 Tax=Penicillium verhagenii TaxID=1562060 RepID=UPI00254503D8|nr:uncharacterized protein N7466_006501 [Penicillium verhagenii]KAJ5931008.1 hypothetical protein N7466_006501 [Penicillium verhagenii]